MEWPRTESDYKLAYNLAIAATSLLSIVYFHVLLTFMGTSFLDLPAIELGAPMLTGTANLLLAWAENVVNATVALLPVAIGLGWSGLMFWDMYVRPITRPETELGEEERFERAFQNWMGGIGAPDDRIEQLQDELAELKEDGSA